jgi:isoaspartyl peptidase/L-asparaginase-like protein (Ntn-hydrolase superfamily)
VLGNMQVNINFILNEEKHNLLTAENEKEFENFNISKKKKEKYLKYKEMINNLENVNLENNFDNEKAIINNDKIKKKYKKEFSDTIGGICVDKSKEICSGVSSGGIFLKKEGRVGNFIYKIKVKLLYLDGKFILTFVDVIQLMKLVNF